MTPIAGLAALNFFLADVQTGLGPFLATWLSTTGWDPARIVATFQGIGAASSATLGGLLAERLGWEAAFLGLAAPAALALVLALWLRGQASSSNAAAISLRV